MMDHTSVILNSAACVAEEARYDDRDKISSTLSKNKTKKIWVHGRSVVTVQKRTALSKYISIFFF